jgi:hypothetical protein
VRVQVTLVALDGVQFSATADLHEDTSAEAIADAMLTCQRGAAAMLGPALQVALAHRMAP